MTRTTAPDFILYGLYIGAHLLLKKTRLRLLGVGGVSFQHDLES